MIDLAAGAFDLPRDGRVAGSLDAKEPRPASPTSPGSTTSISTGRCSPICGSAVRAQPAFDGTVRVDGARYENGTTGAVLRDLTLLVEADRQTIGVERFTATDGGAGRLNGQGTVTIDAAAGYPLDVRVQLERARLVARDDATATMSGRVALGGNATARAHRRDYRRSRRDLDTRAARAASRGPAGGRDRRAARQARDFRRRQRAIGIALGLGLTVAMTNQVFVRGRGLDSEWQGQVRVEGTVERPRASGTLNLDAAASRCSGGGSICAGHHHLHRREPAAPAPRYRSRGPQPRYYGRGPDHRRGERPEIVLDSEPPLPQDEILARLLFGRSRASSALATRSRSRPRSTRCAAAPTCWAGHARRSAWTRSG